MRDLPTGTLTMLFTDIEGSTTLLHALGDRYSDVLAQHREVLRAAFVWYGGVEVDTQGDAFFYVFPQATGAVAAVVAAQRSLAEYPWPAGLPVRVRMGLHTGEPRRTEQGYVGFDVHRAARVAAAGHGGQVLLSRATGNLVATTLPPGVNLRSLGSYQLKDIAEREWLYQLDIIGLPDDFPPIRALESHPNNLPVPPTPLVDRVLECETIATMLRRDDGRLVTLTGPGGTGKTRLALRVATDLLHEFRDGAFFVPLAALSDPALVLPAIARALGIREVEGIALADLLTGVLREKDVLLVLDNAEQLPEAAPDIAALLAVCPRVKALVTSRASLRVSGEWEHLVPPLDLPEPGQSIGAEGVSQYAAVTLFVERAVAVRANFRVTNENAPAVAELCARLDGLPLAIELAAARIRVFTPEMLLARIGRRLDVLTGGGHDLPRRQQTLRDAIAWSADLLSPVDSKLFRRLGVFAGSWALEMAETVCGERTGNDPPAPADTPLPTAAVLDGLVSLVDKSLVRRGEASWQARFSMLETIREFALERLAQSGEMPDLRRRHAVAMLESTEQRLSAFWTAGHSDFVTGAHDLDQDNLRAALGWAAETGTADIGMRLVGLLGDWFGVRAPAEGRALAERMLALPGATTVTTNRALALRCAGICAWYRGDHPAAYVFFTEAATLFRALNEPAWLGRCLSSLCHVIPAAQLGQLAALGEEAIALCQAHDGPVGVATVQGEVGAALFLRLGALEAPRALLEESLRAARRLDLTWLAGADLLGVGLIAQIQRDSVTARALFEQAVPVLRAQGERLMTGVALSGLAELARVEGDQNEALRRHIEALAVYRELGNAGSIATSVLGLAGMFATVGRGEVGARLLGAVDAALADGLLSLPEYAGRQVYDTARAAVASILTEEAFERAHTVGRSRTLAEAAVEALAVASEATGVPANGQALPT